MLVAASLISSLGLMSDSSVTIVGAMLIAPLMRPIMSISYGFATGEWLLKLRSLLTLAIGISLTLLISYGAEVFLGFATITEQMNIRISPNLFDLGVAIAVGIAGALAMTRKSIAASLPGVAISVALLPPLCVSGISFGMGEMDAFYGSLLLFSVNLFAIIISATIVFLLSGYGSIKYAVVILPLLLLTLSILFVPLKHSLNVIVAKDKVQDVVATWLHKNYPHNSDIHPGDLNDIGVIHKDDHVFVYLELKSSENGLSNTQLADIHKRLEKRLYKPVNLKVQLLLTQELTAVR